MKRKIFLQWWLLTTVIMIGSAFLYHFNIFNLMWQKDTTMISAFIVLLFTFMSYWCGIKAWTLSKVTKTTIKSEADFICRKTIRLIEWGWFVAQTMLGLGMLGTVIGFLILFTGFSSVDVSDTTSLQKLLSNVAQGAGIALITTIAGLTCSILLKFQYFLLENEVRFIQNNIL